VDLSGSGQGGEGEGVLRVSTYEILRLGVSGVKRVTGIRSLGGPILYSASN